ncbi:MAG: tripartite tricarboxylate transporter substrate binding protein [bacterium]
MMKFSTAVSRILTAGVLVAFAGSAAAQQAYPNKLIRCIVPYAPGGGASNMARFIGQKLAESLGQQVIIDNRPGGNTIIGGEALVRSPPDGYTIMLTTNAHVINPNLFRNLPYDPIKDFAPVATVYSSELALALHPSVPANNLQEFIALAKSMQGRLNYASTGNGSPNQLANELFNMMVGVKMQHIPYKGSGQAIADLLGGQVQLYFTPPLPAVPFIKVGKLKAIAVSGETRLPTLPQVPTFTEAGLPGFDVRIWYGVLAPAGTPKDIIDKLSTEIGRILAMRDIKEKLIGLGVEPLISTPDQFAAMMKADLTLFAKIIKAANIKLED